MSTDKLRCLLVDDEPLARDVLRRYVVALPQLELVGECSNAIEAMGVVQSKPVDLLLLDIRMPQLNGNQMVKALRHPPKVIFTTAYPEYAIEGYELEVVDYLLKPVQFDRFIKAINKVQALQGAQPDAEKSALTAPSQDRYVYFRADRKMVKVMLDEIVFIESMKDYLKIVTTGPVIITRQSMASTEAMLPPGRFIRIHRSYIVNAAHIKSYTSELMEIGKTELPVGKMFRAEVQQKLGKPA